MELQRYSPGGKAGGCRIGRASPPSTLLTASGSFQVAPTDKAVAISVARRLQYVGKRYLQFATGEYFLKAGADSPENLLATSTSTAPFGERAGVTAPMKRLRRREVLAAARARLAVGRPELEGREGQGLIGG